MEPPQGRELKFLDRPEVGRVLFHPRPERDRPAPDGLLVVDVRARDGTLLRGRLSPAGPEAPLLLWFPGNGELAQDYDALAPHLRDLGVGLLVFDHRGYGASAGRPSAGDLLRDADDVRRALTAKLASAGLHPSRLVVVGRSLGSAPAIDLAAHAGPEVDGLLLLSPFADTFGLLTRLGYGASLDDRDERLDGFCNLDGVRAVHVPVLCLHGTADRVIPFHEGRALAEAAHGRFVPLDGAGHNDWFSVGHDAFFAAVRELVITAPTRY
ncbi:MAG: alpha/beta fold hydrolase [Planctomycetota bacterium]